MTTWTLTSRGQLTLRKSVLQHLGIKPGEKVRFDLLRGGRVAIRAIRPTGSIEDIFGLLANKTTRVATIAEISEAAADGWAGLIN